MEIAPLVLVCPFVCELVALQLGVGFRADAGKTRGLLCWSLRSA